MKPEINNTEQHIIEVARQVFIEKGYAEASMSDIASRAGINRPGLHYYFRTKERLFEAVFADIVYSFIPTIHQIVMKNVPISQRISEIADVYFDLMLQNPSIPIFAVREIQRDASHLIKTIGSLEIGKYALKIKMMLLAEMKRGNIRRMPLEHVLYTFYGLMLAPFLSKPVTDVLFDSMDDMPFEHRVQLWKPQVVRQMCMLLAVEQKTPDNEKLLVGN